jgi:hypothetical protein
VIRNSASFVPVPVKADITPNLRDSQEMNNFFEGTQNFNKTLFGLIAKHLQFKITTVSNSKFSKPSLSSRTKRKS